MKKYLSLIALCFTANVYANQATSITKITQIQNWTSGEALYVWTSESTKTNPNNCSYSANYHMPSSTSELSKSMLLTAYAAQKDVKLTIYGGGCSSSRPQIVAVQLVD